jgi:hypothetical protein
VLFEIGVDGGAHGGLEARGAEALQQLEAPELVLDRIANGEAVNGDAFYDRDWKPALEALQIRLPPVKNTRHTFITTALEQRWSPVTVARYCGTSLEMIDKHYAGVIEASLDADLSRLPVGTVPKTASHGGKE